jgi:lipid-A-disaccharide synthase
MRIALTCNGPGEFAGWIRPLVAALYEIDPSTDVSVFFVPDDYATGREPDVARELFPAMRVFGSQEYLRFALGRSLPNAPKTVDAVQYLGGDLAHAVRLHSRLGGRARSYKFWSKSYEKTFERVYTLDAGNEASLHRQGLSPDCMDRVGNLAVDGVLGEVAGRFGTRDLSEIPEDGVLILPGNRRNEIANMTPMFLQVALRLRRLAPGLPIAFGISPFTEKEELERALAAGGHRLAWGTRGTVIERDGRLWLQALGDTTPIPVVRDAMRYAAKARLVVTIPGTKCIELAALGVPAIVCTPLNAPEVIVINGPLQYLDRIPFVGIPLKRAAVVAGNQRFRFTAQPNIDAGEMLMPELRGALTPGSIATAIAAYAEDESGRRAASERLGALYLAHAGAAMRMARSLTAT